MIAYLDTSVVLRIILNQPEPLREWNILELGVSSRLLQIECHRTLDRFWQEGQLDESDVEMKRSAVADLFTRLEVLPIDDRVVEIASRTFPAIIGSLDAIHLASAILYRNNQPPDERPIIMATHDRQFAGAARAVHFDVIGAPA